MISLHTVTHPNIFELIKLIIAIAGTTGPLERSYSKLAKICYKDRNQLTSPHFETLYLLSLLKDYQFDYNDAINELEK